MSLFLDRNREPPRSKWYTACLTTEPSGTAAKRITRHLTYFNIAETRSTLKKGWTRFFIENSTLNNRRIQRWQIPPLKIYLFCTQAITDSDFITEYEDLPETRLFNQYEYEVMSRQFFEGISFKNIFFLMWRKISLCLWGDFALQRLGVVRKK